VTRAFAQAIDEEAVETVTREQMIQQLTPPLVPVPRLPPTILQAFDTAATTKAASGTADKSPPTTTTNIGNRQTPNKREVMRKHMTRVLEEVLTQDESIVYMGEDVKHGGYYLVTDGLAQKFPGRVLDFPPDETSLLGAAMGFAQLGLMPIVEIPYAKYLDCGADMFYESAVMNWLTNGQCPNGMIVRLQGFDRGLFGGNFHTHNMLSHIPPGIDVVCYSNGEDYVRGFRHAVRQARDAKRIVMTVDCTNLLNLRHLYDKLDRKWERYYPELKDGDDATTSCMNFDEVRRHGTQGKWAIVTYGNGVVTSLQARKSLLDRKIISHEEELDVIDCPYLSAVPKGLSEISLHYQGILFADICKEGPGSNVLSSMITALQQDDLLPKKWRFVGAPRTYNPLGSTVTFLNVSDVEKSFQKLAETLRVVAVIGTNNEYGTPALGR
jgi:2-oxoisovalerate dehydrogenase E1 component